jgi:hypothetical protein
LTPVATGSGANVTGELLDIGALAGSTGGIYNRIGRGIPDVAANGDNIAVRITPDPPKIMCKSRTD